MYIHNLRTRLPEATPDSGNGKGNINGDINGNSNGNSNEPALDQSLSELYIQCVTNNNTSRFILADRPIIDKLQVLIDINKADLARTSLPG